MWTMNNLKLKSDKYRKARGGYSRFLNVFCHHCGHKVLMYQKDGPCELKRLYMDRIFFQKNLLNYKTSRSKMFQILFALNATPRSASRIFILKKNDPPSGYSPVQ